MDGFAYLPGEEAQKSVPLGRFLPPVPDGIVSAFLALHVHGEGVPADACVLDPFGASPSMAIEMAREHRRVLAAVNNPVAYFLMGMAAQPPSRDDLRAALAELASARKGEDRLETHLQSLYLTECTRCQQQVPAEAFIWERDSGELVGRLYHCHCGDGGEYPATDADKARAASHAGTDSLHRSRALERVTTREDPDRPNTEEALQCYLPRAVYALITIINKLDSLSLPPERRRALLALVLSACDESSSLWAYPGERHRPRQLTIPPRFLEKNVWQALERGVDLWSNDNPPVPVTRWPELPGAEGGLCLFEGPVRDLAPHLKDLPLAAVVTTLPRPNQAYWTLSALWAGWLWGREATAQFKPVLRRRRFDWSWHTGALQAALRNLPERLPLNTPFFALIPEVEPSFLSTALVAASAAGFDLSGLAFRTRLDPVEVLWHRRAFSHERQEEASLNQDNVLQALHTALLERAEPATYLFLHAAGLTSMAQDHSLSTGEDALNQAAAPIHEALAHPEFIHYTQSANPEIGLWGLAQWDPAADPLPDRLEIAVVQLLQKNTTCTQQELETQLNATFPGLMTPSWGMLRAVLASYAVESEGRWSLRSEDSASLRRADLESAESALANLGARLGYSLQQEESPYRLVLWQEQGETRYAFYLLASAVIGRLLRKDSRLSLENKFIVLPGGRASLLAYKLNRDPSLDALARGWRMVKFRHLRRLAEMASLSREHFEKNLSTDPIEPPEQMKLF